MNAGGVLGSMCFPSFPGFSGRLFAAVDDKDLALAVVRAYNDWHVDEWCGAYPGRFIPMGLPVLWDPELAADEVRRLVGQGRATRSPSPRTPHTLGYPSFHSDHWDPLWKALSRHRHRAVDPPRLVGPAGGHRPRRAGRRDDHAAADEHLPGGRRPAVVAGPQAVPRPRASPSPRAAPAGSRTSSTASTAPTTCTTSGPARTSATSCPSEVFREHFLTCFIADPVGIELRDHIGIDNIAWECDYPHSDSSWPEAPEELATVAAGVSDDDLDKIGYENACAGTPSTRSPTGPRSTARSARCGPRPATTTWPSARSTRAATSVARASRSASWPPRPLHSLLRQGPPHAPPRSVLTR